MKIIHAIHLLGVPMLLCACTTMRSDVDSKGMTQHPVFPALDSLTAVRGTWPSEDRLSKIHAGMTKAQIMDLIGPPHAPAGLINVHEWDYLLHIGPGGESAVCQYKILFDVQMRARSFYSKPAGCVPEVSSAPPATRWGEAS